MRKIIINTFVAWLPLAAGVCIIYGIMYLSIQQYIRLSANEEPLRYAQDMRNAIAKGNDQSEVAKQLQRIDLRESPSPFVIVYDNNQKVVFSSATINGNVPQIPPGILKYAQEHGEDRVTWMPSRDIRTALVVLPLLNNSGFVVAGRSLWETEKRESMVLWQAAVGLLVTLAVTFFVTLLVNSIKQKLTPV